MATRRIDFQKVVLSKELLIRKDWVKYLVLVNWHAREFENLLKRPADAGFTDFIEKHVQAYLDGTAPPEAIQTAVLNIADDVAAGREVTVKAGDYIALHTQYLADKH
jgi:hypothetical protein